MCAMKSTPRTIYRGIQDVSGRVPTPSAPERPTHLPKVWFFAKEGPTEPMLVAADAIANIYNPDSFDERGKFTTHATILMNQFIGAGNGVMCHRVIDPKAKPPAGYRLCADVLETELPEYERNADGTFVLDATGNPVPTGNVINGREVKFVVEPIGVDVDGATLFGRGQQRAGDRTDGTNQSIRVPIYDSQVNFQGSYGNDIANRFWAPDQNSLDPVNVDFIAKYKAYPFRFVMLRRGTPIATPGIVSSVYGEQYVEVTLKPDLVDTDTGIGKYLGTDVIPRYQDLDSTEVGPQYSPIGRIHVYENYLADLIQELYETEYAAQPAGIDSDFDGSEDEQYKFNLLGGVHSSGAPYSTYHIVSDETNAQRMSELSNIYCVGGDDGEISNAMLDDLIDLHVNGYADENSELQTHALYPESIIYDSGSRLSTKYNLIKFIAVRKDTSVVLSCHQADGDVLTAAEESSLAVTLRTRLRLYPESNFYGTDTVRGVIVGRSGKLLNSHYKKELPITIELAYKSAQYMGAGNGVWDSKYAFDREPNNQLQLFKNLNVKTTSARVRNKDWDNGMVWVEPFDTRAFFFPGIRTVYSDDTSVLTSYFNMLICVELEKIGGLVHRKLSGAQGMTAAQVIDFVEREINKEVSARNNFDNRVVVQPVVTITDQDASNGFSWTTVIKVFMPNMVTVQTLSIQSNRINDLAAA